MSSVRNAQLIESMPRTMTYPTMSTSGTIATMQRSDDEHGRRSRSSRCRQPPALLRVIDGRGGSGVGGAAAASCTMRHAAPSFRSERARTVRAITPISSVRKKSTTPMPMSAAW